MITCIRNYAPNADPPTCKTIFDFLKNKSSKWDEIGRESDIDLNYREILYHDVSITDEGKLERVIAKWDERNPVTWNSFIAVLRKLQFNDVIDQLKEKGYIIDSERPS